VTEIAILQLRGFGWKMPIRANYIGRQNRFRSVFSVGLFKKYYGKAKVIGGNAEGFISPI